MTQAQRRAAPRQARASARTLGVLRPSMPVQAGIEPRASFPVGDRPAYPAADGLT